MPEEEEGVPGAEHSPGLSELRVVESFIRAWQPPSSGCPEEARFNTVIVEKPRLMMSVSCFSPCSLDPFLGDEAPLRLQISTNSAQLKAGLVCSVSRAPVSEPLELPSSQQWEQKLIPLLEKLYGGSSVALHCTGFDTVAYEDVFGRLRKTDLPHLLIEHFRGSVLFKAKNCQSVIWTDSNEYLRPPEWQERLSGRHCGECIRLFQELDEKYTCSRYTTLHTLEIKSDQNTVVEEATIEKESPEQGEESTVDDGSSKKRGRPKGSKNRAYLYSTDYVHPDDVIAKSSQSNASTQSEENAEPSCIKVEEELDRAPEEGGAKVEDIHDDHASDQDFVVNIRKSSRRRKLSRKALSDLSRPRKRGRPPIVTDPVSCKVCGEVFTVLRDFKDHCASHTNNFPCDVEGCTKRFRIQFDLEVHQRRHRGENPFLCTECEKVFDSKVDLKTHMRQHKGKRPYPCEVCSKSFAREQQRKIHMVTHTGEKPCLCPECGNSFGSFSTLIDHRKRKHLEMRDHKCTECPKGFFTRQELEAHVRTHTGDKPFLCTECGKGFSRTHHLKRHIQSVHKGLRLKPNIPKKKMPLAQSNTLEANVPVNSSTGVFKIEEDLQGEIVLVTTEDDQSGGILVRDIQQYVVENQPGNDKFTAIAAPDGSILVETRSDFAQ